MKTLKNEQIKAISGGSKGIYYEGGKAYPVDCPLVSQACLDRFLICTDEKLSEKELYDCLKSVTNDFSAFQLVKVIDCVDDHLN